MSEATSVPEVESTPQAPEPATEPSEPEAPEQRTDPAAESKKYRQRAQAAEAERDGLAARVERLQRAEVAALAGASLAVAADVFDVGRVELADLLDEDGDVDASKVASAVEELLTSRPGLRRQAVRRWPNTGQGYGKPVDDTDNSWSSVLRGS